MVGRGRACLIGRQMSGEEIRKDVGPDQEVRGTVGEGLRVTKNGLVDNRPALGQRLNGLLSGSQIPDFIPALGHGEDRRLR